jgi:biopolymer transport protein ExbD
MKGFDQINVIPFIDIMLVLLAIVLATATFIVQGKLDIALPEADSQAPISTKPRLELAIDRHRMLYYKDQPIELEALRAHLGKVSKDTSIVLRVDAAVPFARFVQVIDVLKAHQLERLAILTRDGQ